MRVAIVTSDKECGVLEASKILLDGFRECGHDAVLIGVANWDDHQLEAKVNSIDDLTNVVIFEYEPGIFTLKGLLRQLLRLRLLRRKKVWLSIHEIEPLKFPLRHKINQLVDYRSGGGIIRELARSTFLAFCLSFTFLAYRIALLMLGRIPHRIIIHSRAIDAYLPMIGNVTQKLRYVPLPAKPLTGDKLETRRKLGLPEDAFIFLIPGFFFKRKRILDVIRNIPLDCLLVIAGSDSKFEPGQAQEISRYLQTNSTTNVVLREGYGEFVENHMIASDAVVLFYDHVFQSATACQAIGAGKPCILSNIPGLQMFAGAAIFVNDEFELRKAFNDMRNPRLYSWLVTNVMRYREELAPRKTAQMYLT